MKIKYSTILMWMLVLSPVADNINGYLLLTGKNSNISIIFKTIIFLLCLVIAIKITTIQKIIQIICMLFFLVVQLVVFELNSPGGAGYNISTLIKLLTPIVIVMAVRVLSVYDKNIISCINKITDFYCWFFPISLIIPKLFNIGYSTYAGGVGSKGFYFSGNEISIVMIIILALEIEKYKNSRSRTNLFNVLLGMISVLYLGTKSVYISLVIFIVVALYSEQNINKKLLNFILITPTIFLGLWYVINNVTLVTQNINTLIWKYNVKSTGIINFLLSGRELQIINARESVYSENIIRKIFWGIGPNMAENELRVLIEMDLLDLFIRFGLIVSIIIVRFYIKYIKKIMQTKQILYIIGVCLVYGASFFSGHMMFSPMVSIVLVVLLLKIEFAPEIMEKIS